MSQHRNVLAMISPMSAQRVAGIAQYAKEHAWNLLIMDWLGYHPVAWKGDGVLATLRSDPVTFGQIKKLMDRGVPIVDVTVNRPEVKVARVVSDHAEIGRLAGRYFAERRFAHTAWFSTSWGHVHRLRYDGFAEECASLPSRWVVDEALSRSKAGEWDAVRDWLRRQLSAVEKPLAVLAYDETDAARLLYAAEELGVKVPEELSILSIGNDPLICENQAIPLSSIDQNLFLGGYEAAAMLDRLMSGEQPSMTLVPPVGVVERRSTADVAISDATVRRAVEYIKAHLGNAIGSPQIAEAIGVRRAVFDQLFQREFTHSVGEEIRRLRLAQAKLLLRTTDLPVGTIAHETGYCSPSHLSNAFRDAFGESPNAWRKTCRRCLINTCKNQLMRIR